MSADLETLIAHATVGLLLIATAWLLGRAFFAAWARRVHEELVIEIRGLQRRLEELRALDRMLAAAPAARGH